MNWYPEDKWLYDAVWVPDSVFRTDEQKREDRRKLQQYLREKVERGECTSAMCRVPVVAFQQPYTQTWVLAHGECQLLFWRAEDHEKVWYSDSGPNAAIMQYHSIDYDAHEEEWLDRVIRPERGAARRMLWHAGEL